MAENQELATVASREERAREVIRSYSAGNAAVSLVPIPLFDLVAITGVQVKMVHSLSKVYDIEFRGDIVKSLVISLLGGLGSMAVARGVFLGVLKLVPGLGLMTSVLALPAMSAAVTYAVGRVFIMHFEAGGTLLDFNPEKFRDYFEKFYKEGLDLARRRSKVEASAE